MVAERGSQWQRRRIYGWLNQEVGGSHFVTQEGNRANWKWSKATNSQSPLQWCSTPSIKALRTNGPITSPKKCHQLETKCSNTWIYGRLLLIQTAVEAKKRKNWDTNKGNGATCPVKREHGRTGGRTLRRRRQSTQCPTPRCNSCVRGRSIYLLLTVGTGENKGKSCSIQPESPAVKMLATRCVSGSEFVLFSNIFM